MILTVSFSLECGETIKQVKEYFWNTTDEKQNQIETSRYESFMNFNRVGNELQCNKHNNYERIRRVTVYVMEFDARSEII